MAQRQPASRGCVVASGVVYSAVEIRGRGVMAAALALGASVSRRESSTLSVPTTRFKLRE